MPASVLSQLGLKIQHALRAFTAQARKNIKTVSENYPFSDFYKTEDLLTQLGIGEAFITALNEKGVPTPLVHVLLNAPQSRMDILEPQEIDARISKSTLVKKYNQIIDRESAFEILNSKIEANALETKAIEQEKEVNKRAPKSKQDPSVIRDVVDSTAGRQIMRTVARELTRGLLGVLGVGATQRKATKKRTTGWF